MVLEQGGSTLEGKWTYKGYTGVVTNGEVTEDQIKLNIFYRCTYDVSATVVDGCTWEGNIKKKRLRSGNEIYRHTDRAKITTSAVVVRI